MKLEYLSRAQWGSTAATETFIKNRYSATATEKTTIQAHHTASIDRNDTTPNRWTRTRAIAYMKSLQWARPELGPLPYSINFAVSEDVQTVWVFEGRGPLKVGAHTAGHNRDGLGLGVFGNFDTKDGPAAAALITAMEVVCRDLKYGTSVVPWLKPRLPNLGTVANSNGWEAWGHRDSSPKSCPGNHLYPLLANFTLEDDDMPLSESDLAAIKESQAQAIREELQLVTSSDNDGDYKRSRVVTDSLLRVRWNEKGIGAGTTPDSITTMQAIVRNFKLSRDIQSTVKLTRTQLAALVAGGVAVGATAPEIVAEIGRLLSGG